MAKLTETLKEKILADFHAGKTQNSLAKIYSLSKATINKLCKGVDPENINIVNTLTAIETVLLGKSEQKVNAVRSEVSERIKHIDFFNNATIKNLQLMTKKLGANTSIVDHRVAQAAIKDGRDTVLGKNIDTAIQINNNSAAQIINAEQARRVAQEILIAEQ